MASTIPLTLETIQAARGRIREFVHRTPVLTCSYLDQISGFKLFFKCENFQKTGSFKVIGLIFGTGNSLLIVFTPVCGGIPLDVSVH